MPSFVPPPPKLTPARRAELRAAAHALHPVVIIGGDGLTDAVVRETDRALASHGLIKVRVHGDDREARMAILAALGERLGAAPVQTIGKLLVIYRDGPAVLEEDQAEMLRERQPAKVREAAAPKTVVIRKPASVPGRKPTTSRVRVLGNERVTEGGIVKRRKPRPASRKKQALG